MPEYCAAKAAVLQYARSMAPLLKSKENIAMNVVLPNGVDTPAMPNFAEAFLPEHLTTPECLLRAYDLILEDIGNNRVGMAVETGHDDIYFHDVPAVKGGDITVRSTLVYEPWFEYLHGEKSGLANALLKPPSK